MNDDFVIMLHIQSTYTNHMWKRHANEECNNSNGRICTCIAQKYQVKMTHLKKCFWKNKDLFHFSSLAVIIYENWIRIIFLFIVSRQDNFSLPSECEITKKSEKWNKFIFIRKIHTVYNSTALQYVRKVKLRYMCYIPNWIK